MRNSKFYIVYAFCIFMLGWTSPSVAQTIPKTLNVQGVLKAVSGGTLTGSYGMRFTFKKNSAAFATPCVVTKSSVAVVNGVFNAAVSTTACNLANEISNATAATISVDIEVDTASGGAFSSASATFSGITVNPVAMSLIAERANGLLVTGTSGQVLTFNGSTWAAATPSAGGGVSSVAGRGGAVTLTTADISGLGSSAMLNTSAVFQTANNLSELAASPSAARTNLGLGSLAVISPSGSASSTTYLRGDGSWATAPGAPVSSVAGRTGTITLSTSDISGLGSLSTISPSGSASSSTYLRGDGAWASLPTAPVTTVAGRTGDISLGTIDIAGLGSASALSSSEVLQTANNLSELSGSAPTVRANIGAAASGANSDITSMSQAVTFSSVDVHNSGVQLKASGAGSTVLSHYEEGTCSAALIGSTAAGAATTTTNTCVFSRIGRLIQVNISLVWTAHSGTGNMIVTGLPYNSNSTTGMVQPCIISWSNMTFGGRNVVGEITAGTNRMNVMTGGATGSATTALAMDTAASMNISCNYQM